MLVKDGEGCLQCSGQVATQFNLPGSGGDEQLDVSDWTPNTHPRGCRRAIEAQTSPLRPLIHCQSHFHVADWVALPHPYPYFSDLTKTQVLSLSARHTAVCLDGKTEAQKLRFEVKAQEKAVYSCT